MKRSIVVASLALACSWLGGCEGYYGPETNVGWNSYPYSGWYDGFYGPFYDGYWGRDNFFYFRLRPDDERFRRGDSGHFQRQGPRSPGPQFRPFEGTMRPPPQGTRMPSFRPP